MKADVSRVTFDPLRHASSVRKQQGRVDLDADWNEQRDIDLHLRLTSLLDIIGPAGAPIDGGAFAITPSGGDLVLSAGRYYVGGVVCECDQDVSLFAQPDLPSGGPLVSLGAGKWVIPPAGVPAGVYVAWLDAWQQHRTVVEEPALRETALGGPDTTTRARTVWQVRLLSAGGPGAVVGCADLPPDGASLTAPSTGTLAASADPTGPPASDCTIPIGSPYRGLDNQFYRVEIHAAGGPGAATYVWSRDNGSVLVSWEATDVDTITVKSAGRDGSDGFTSGCWVELTDDRNEQLGLPGTLVQVERAEADSLVLKLATATGTVDHAQFSGHPRARRWDGTGAVPGDGSNVALELGISARFSSDPAATYRTYDYWSFPARAATHDIEWPQAAGAPAALVPHGPAHRHARLAVLAFDGSGWTLQRDCRPLFAPLVDQLALAYLSGDTQEALPDITNPAALVTLGHQLVAGVANGGRPIAGARVRFQVTGGSGRLGGTGGELTVTTGADGLAQTAWEVDSSSPVQTVVCVLLAEDDTPRGLPVTFSARLARADGVAYDPAACANLAGATTVQTAIDRLCGMAGGGCDTLSLVPGTDWATALESLAPESDATVCFRPGGYATTRTVRLQGLGHIRLTGGGVSTQLTGSDLAELLVFANCRSVTIEDLAVEVGGSVPEHSGLLGVVTMLDCDLVDLHRVRLTCPAGTKAHATCLTVRTGGEDLVLGDAQRRFIATTDRVAGPVGERVVARDIAINRGPTRGAEASGAMANVELRRRLVIEQGAAGVDLSTEPAPAAGPVTTTVRVRDCEFVVGHAQTGVLVVNVDRAIVSGSSFTTPDLPESLGLAALLAEPSRLAKMARQVAGRLVIDRPGKVNRAGFNTALRVSDFVVRLNSQVPEPEWQKALTANPPTAADTANADGVAKFVQRVAETVRATPSVLPTFDRQVKGLRFRLGANAEQFLGTAEGKASVAALLGADQIDVKPVVAGVARRSVNLPVADTFVRFASPVTQTEWEAALAAKPTKDTSPSGIAKHIRTVSIDVLRDPAFSAAVMPGLLAGLATRNQAAASCGVRVAGETVGHVVVEGNRLTATAEAIHVAASGTRAKGRPTRRVESVRITGNDIVLSVPVEVQRAPRAVFVGNARRTVVIDNRVGVLGGKALAGIHVEGTLGAHIVVRDNDLADCETGVRVVEHGPAPASGLWVVADNRAPGASPVAELPAGARDTGNVG